MANSLIGADKKEPCLLPWIEVEEIYFAGGEPLLSEEHYLVLEESIRRKRTNTKITRWNILKNFPVFTAHLICFKKLILSKFFLNT